MEVQSGCTSQTDASALTALMVATPALKAVGGPQGYRMYRLRNSPLQMRSNFLGYPISGSIVTLSTLLDVIVLERLADCKSKCGCNVRLIILHRSCNGLGYRTNAACYPV